MILLLILKNLMRGTKEIESIIGLETCSTEFWIIFVAYTVALIIIFIIQYFITRVEESQIEFIGYHVDYYWSLRDFLVVVIISTLAGMNTAIIGVGIAFIYSPTMK